MSLEIDPIVKRAVADAVVERAATELRKLMVEVAQALDPFPKFMDLDTIQALEIDPSGAPDPERGCVVVCPDGQLYDLTLRMIPGAGDNGDTDQVEEFKSMELSDGDYVAYAHAAIREMTRILLEREDSP